VTRRRLLEIEGENGCAYLVRGDDPEEIFRLAADEAYSDERIVLTEPDEVRIVWLRAIPCTRHNCDFGNHAAHYVEATPRSRGAFQGAFIEVIDEWELLDAYTPPRRKIDTVDVSSNRL
jgi:hypothetical protein